MRKLPFLLVLLLLLAAAASAHALSLKAPPAVASVASQIEDEEGEEDGEGEEAGVSEADEEGICGAEEDEACEADESSEGDGCVVNGAKASMSLAPSVDQVRLTVRYRASEPTVVVLSSRLRGVKGGLHLGTDRARFNRMGTYRDSFQLAPKQMPKALAARELEVDLQAIGAPAACALRLATRAPHRAR
jgi:hypothetical protein